MKRLSITAAFLALIMALCGSSLFADGSKIIIDTFSDLWPQYMTEALQKAGLADQVEIRTVPQNQYENKLKLEIAGGDVGDVI
jgi:ABC-type glycerol-3-phosphate transport system substrate-binding protein